MDHLDKLDTSFKHIKSVYTHNRVPISTFVNFIKYYLQIRQKPIFPENQYNTVNSFYVGALVLVNNLSSTLYTIGSDRASVITQNLQLGDLTRIVYKYGGCYFRVNI